MSYILTIVGARPQFVKAAVVSKAFSNAGIKERIIHTGQHYDHNMSTVFWDELGIPAPSVNLGIGSGNHGAQTGEMLKLIEEYILNNAELPRALLVYGDTNSTLSGALVASKLHIPVVHIEAGLRSFNREMPEEINRIATDHISDLLFCSSKTGVKQLAKEGIINGVFDTGDVMHDAVLTFSEIASAKIRLSDLIDLPKNEFTLATIHRPSNTDIIGNLDSILKAFTELEVPIVWPVHPRNKKQLSSLELPPNLYLLEPASYFEMLTLLKHCKLVITDSGGLQKEAYWLKKQCITLRNETEWIETLYGGWNRLVGSNKDKIIEAFNTLPDSDWAPLYGKGNASEEIVLKIKKHFSL